MDGIIGLDYWMVFFHPNMGSVADAKVVAAQAPWFLVILDGTNSGSSQLCGDPFLHLDQGLNRGIHKELTGNS